MQYIVDDDRKYVNSQTKNCMTNDTNCYILISIGFKLYRFRKYTLHFIHKNILEKKEDVQTKTNNYAIYIK
jgi:hypothetical protein